MSMNRNDYEQKAAETWTLVEGWGTTHHFLAGLVIGLLVGLFIGAVWL